MEPAVSEMSEMPVMPTVMPTPIDHYARMKFKMYSSVYSSLSPKISGTITGWSTNGDKGEETTYCYQLNNGGQLIQETELTANPEEAAPADAAADATAATPAADAAADATAATPAADAPADATAAPTDAQSTPS